MEDYGNVTPSRTLSIGTCTVVASNWSMPSQDGIVVPALQVLNSKRDNFSLNTPPMSFQSTNNHKEILQQYCIKKQYTSLIEIEIDLSTTHAGSSLVLLNGRMTPSSERTEITK